MLAAIGTTSKSAPSVVPPVCEEICEIIASGNVEEREQRHQSLGVSEAKHSTCCGILTVYEGIGGLYDVEHEVGCDVGRY